MVQLDLPVVAVYIYMGAKEQSAFERVRMVAGVMTLCLHALAAFYRGNSGGTIGMTKVGTGNPEAGEMLLPLN